MINHMILQGRMVADPELRDTNGGIKVANFRVAWNEKYKDRERKLYLECKTFGAQAEFVGKFFKKGQEINVEGRLETEEWENQDVQKRSKIVLMLEKVHFAGKKESGGSDVQPSMTPVNMDGDLPF